MPSQLEQQAHNLLRYLRDCLAQERARAGVPSLFAGKIASRRFIKGKEKATLNEFASLDLPPSELSALAVNASLRQRDTELFYTSFVVASQQKDKKLYSPLLLYPIEVVPSGDSLELRIAHDRVTLNPALIHLFDLNPSFESELLSLLPTGEINLATPGLLSKDLATQITEIDTQPCEAFPQLLTPKEIQTFPRSSQPALLPAAALILVEKSKNVAGLLHEIESLIARPFSEFPAALRSFLGDSTAPPSSAPDDLKKNFVPALLSSAQERLLASANEQPLTVCHGPPGTGKSFTVAATALDQIARGQSVLIACRSDEAATVIETKIKELIPDSNLIIRAGRSQHLRKLKVVLDQLLSKQPLPPPLDTPIETTLEQQERLLETLHKNLHRRIKKELTLAPLLSVPQKSLCQRFALWNHRRMVNRNPLLAKLLKTIASEQNQRLKLLKAFSRITHHHHIQKHLKREKSLTNLKRYRQAIARRDAATQEKELLTLDLETLISCLPIWITTTDDIHRILPLQSEIFDLVIIDEATQCDLASALPILFRGKRALVTGDPQQLRHLSFLSGDRLTALGDKYQLSAESRELFNYRRVSFLDRVIQITTGTSALNFLDEHFRSLPPLIAFSNKHFYHDALHCMRDVEELDNQNKRAPSFVVHQVNGSRVRAGSNEDEIAAALRQLRTILTKPTEEPPPSLGFLSPFRAQVDLFQQRFQEDFSLTEQNYLLNDHQLIAGTAHSFQGAERDIVLISTVLDSHSPVAARRFLERPDVFNVSITRARHQIHLFTSVQAGELPLNSLLRQYLVHAARERKDSNHNIDPQCAPQGLVDTMQQKGWALVTSKASVAGTSVDLIFQHQNHLLAIDLVGTLDELEQAVSTEKNLLLQRAGLPLSPLSLAEWQICPERAITEILP